MALYDITRTLGRDALAYPGDQPFVCAAVSSLAAGDPCNLARLEMPDHCGTHLDAPAHFIHGAPTMDQIDLQRMFGLTAHVVQIPDEAASIQPPHFDSLTINRGEAVLFKTRNSHLPRDKFSEDYCSLSLEAAQTLVQMRAGLIGLDYLSPDAPDAHDFPVHRLLLSHNILILEDADLSNVPPGRYILYCLPLKLANTSGAPCRAILAET